MPEPRRRSRVIRVVLQVAVIAAVITTTALLSRSGCGGKAPRPSVNGPHARDGGADLRLEALDAKTSLRPKARLGADLGITRADFLGSKACAPCHAAIYDKWRTSTHGRAGGKPPDVATLAPFDGAPIRFRDAVVLPRRDQNEYSFVVRQDGRPERVFKIDGFIGGGHMVGGGTQGAVSRFPDGTYKFLPFDFIRAENTWFCATTAKLGEAWLPITADMYLADCSDWPPQRVLGETPSSVNCESCHGSQIALGLDAKSGVHETKLNSLDIGCESCHGPGRRHVALAGDASAIASGELGMKPLAALSKDESLGVCWSCHALKLTLRRGYLSGKPLELFYSTLLPDPREPAHTPDGRNLRFAYQESHLWSDCYVNGSMTCTSCHDPHTQKYRDRSGAPLVGRFDDRQCTSCHPSKGGAAQEAHTHHKTGSEGSRCTSCHMPFLQQPDIGKAIRYARSDHAIPLPRPGFDEEMGVTNACSMCHDQQEPKTIEAQVKAWYGEQKPHPRAIRAALEIEDVRDVVAAARLVLRADERHAAALLVGMAEFQRRFLGVDLPSLAEEVVARLEALTRHPHADVRSHALASLHLSRGNDPEVKRLLVGRLRAQGAEEWLVRGRWVAALAMFAGVASERGDKGSAVTCFEKAAELEPDNPRLILQLGGALAEAGRHDDALKHYERALDLDAAQPEVLTAMAASLAQRHQRPRAIELLRKAVELSKHDANAHLQLGDLLLEEERPGDAERHFRAAADANPALSAAHFHVARLAAAKGEREAALRALDRGLEHDPNSDSARELLESLHEDGGPPLAR